MPKKYLRKLSQQRVGAFYSKDRTAKAYIANGIIRSKGAEQVIYYCPRKLRKEVQESLDDEVYLLHYEDLRKTNRPFNIAASGDTLLILENVARYKSITSYIYKRLERLSQMCSHKYLIDIIPFSTSIEYLYLPYAYLDRTILGHQHFYAFRENNYEKTPSGQVKKGHDFSLLTQKLAPYVGITYDTFFSNKIELMWANLTDAEHEGYQAKKEELFDEYTTPQPIITRLADYTNTRDSRLEELMQLLNSLTGRTFVYTNIKKHNKKLERRLDVDRGAEQQISLLYNNDVTVRTYYDANGDERAADQIILFEVPITKNYLFLDVIANLRPNCKVYIFRSDAKVDGYLYRKMKREYDALNKFTGMLKEVSDNAWEQDLPRRRCVNES